MDKKLIVKKTDFKDLYIIEYNKYNDERGSFTRLFCQNELESFLNKNIKQINHSLTIKKGIFRGLHFQYPPYSETKIIQCLQGKILDIVVDIRKESPTFLKYFSIELSKDNFKAIIVPDGFAHGFQTLEDNTELLYFHTNFYTPKNEGNLNINDPLLNIKLPIDISNISKKDKEHKFLDIQFKGIDIYEL